MNSSGKKLNLVLEGGGMRGLFTAGVLDCFAEHGIEFEYIYGVSAGACHACSFLSRQKGRAYRIGVDYLDDKRYCGLYSLLTTGDMFGAKMLYETIPQELDLFDYDEFAKTRTKFFAVLTDCEKGEAEYVRITELRRDMIYTRASASLPIVSRIVEIDGKKYLDGGLCDSIPIKAAQKASDNKCVVVLTQPVDYRKSPVGMKWLLKLKYRKYPLLVKKMLNRHIMYNDTSDYIEQSEKNGDIIVIRPEKSLGLGRTEKNREKLYSAYLAGIKQAENAIPAIISAQEED